MDRRQFLKGVLATGAATVGAAALGGTPALASTGSGSTSGAVVGRAVPARYGSPRAGLVSPRSRSQPNASPHHLGAPNSPSGPVSSSRHPTARLPRRGRH